MRDCSESNVSIAPRFVLSDCTFHKSNIQETIGAIMTISLVERPAERRPLWTVGTLLQLPSLWLQRASQRKVLATLDPRQMRDCGLNSLDVYREAMKPFWRA